MHSNVGFAIIGCGYWGVNYIRVLRELPLTCPVVVCDVREERLEDVKQRFPGVAVTNSLEDALVNPAVHAAVVCTDASNHYSVARRCLEADKHTLVEKPLTTSVSQGRTLAELAEARGLRLMVGHTFNYNNGIHKVKELLHRGDMGAVYYLYARRTNLGPVRDDVSALWDLAPHDVSTFATLLDASPLWVSAVGGKFLGRDREDMGFITLGYENGVIGHIHVSWLDPNKVRELVVVAGNKRVVFDDLNLQEPVRVYEKSIKPMPIEAPTFGEYHWLVRNGDIVSPSVEVAEPLKTQCLHFVDCVVRGVRPHTDGVVGLKTVEVMEAVDRSLSQGGTPVPLGGNDRNGEKGSA